MDIGMQGLLNQVVSELGIQGEITADTLVNAVRELVAGKSEAEAQLAELKTKAKKASKK